MTVAVLLAVDDRPDNLFVLEHLVGEYLPEIKMVTATSAEAGLALAVAAAIDGALIDVQMPGMNGIEMCRRLKADPQTASIHVILVTAHQATSELKAQGLEAGADDFITKPIDNVDLAAKLMVMLRLRAAEQALRCERDHLEEMVLERTKALRDSENRSRTLFQTAADPIFINDLEGRILEVNEEACRLLGYTREELLHLTVSDVVSPEYEVRRPEILKQLQTTGLLQFESELITHDRLIIPIECRSRLMDLQGQPAVLSIARDITERKQAEEALKESLARTTAVQYGTIEALATITETRDPYTAGHQRRVTQLACAVARELGLPADRVAGLRVMGLLHDLGKIIVSAEILSKPGKISDTEFAIIKCHAQAGYTIVKEIPFPWPVAEVILQHHERLDGSGYPGGLTGPDIIQEARILAVADVVEAMSSHRPYRPAFGIDKALEEITKNKGILYDPEVVEACLKLFTEKGFRFEAQD
jgi:PAS domain S-box-containing protein/putative nucleotidyltransferase with HDIG domain